MAMDRSIGPFDSSRIDDGADRVHLADVDGDRRLDALTANSQGIFLLRGSRDATFAAQLSTFAAGSRANWVATGDVDGDEDTDLVVTNEESDDVSVLLGDGDGNFLQAEQQRVGEHPQAQIAADLNGDGHLDLAVANRTSDDVSILLGRGSGTFLPQQRYAVGDSPNSLTAADVDRDGDLDLAVTSEGSQTVSVLRNVGDGTFTQATDYATGDAPNEVVATDANGDAALDLVVSAGTSVSVLYGDGRGLFDAEKRYPICRCTAMGALPADRS